MYQVKRIMLEPYEIERAKSVEGMEVEIGTYKEGSLTETTLNHERFFPLLRYLKSLRDLRDYNDDQLEEGYIRSV